MDAISIFDVEVMRGMSFALVPLKISDPGIIADEARPAFASERDGGVHGAHRSSEPENARQALLRTPMVRCLSNMSIDYSSHLM